MSDINLRARLLSQRLKINSNDANAAYELSLHYANGWEVKQNNYAANKLLIYAARLGHADACYELVRKNLNKNLTVAAYFINIGLNRNAQNSELIGLQKTIVTLKAMQDRDKRQFDEAKTMLATKAGITQAIRAEIVPCIISIVTANGGIGSGFFQHSEWLISNAHVLPNTEVLKTSSFVNFDNYKARLEAKRAFHRPSLNPNSPDIVIVKGNTRSNRYNKCLPLSFSF